jgi:hypothetical protein
MRRNREARTNVTNLRKQLVALEKEAEKLGLFDENSDIKENHVEVVQHSTFEDQKLKMMESSLVE